MSRPEDLIPDEMEHPDQTWHLRQSYPVSQDDQRSLLRIRTRLLEQRAAALSAETGVEEFQTEPLRLPFNEVPERPLVGQFLSRHEKPFKPERKRVAIRRVLALVAALCVLVLGGTGYELVHSMALTNHPVTLHVTPTSVTPQMPAHFRLLKVKMTSATTGWASVILVSGATGYTVARTSDSGRSWQAFDFRGQPAGQLGCFFLDDQTAWVTLGSSTNAHSQVTVMHTTDGGKHWTTLHMPPEMTNVTFLDQQHGWAWANSPITGDSVTSSLYQTVNGGATWTRLGMMSTTRSLTDQTTGALPFGTGLDLVFLTPQRGWAVIYPPQVYRRVLYYLTLDGGKTWQLQSLPQPASGPVPGLHTSLSSSNLRVILPTFFTSQSGVFSILSRPNGQTMWKIYLYETNDGGLSWSPSAGRIISGTNGSYPFMFDASHLVIADKKGFMVYTLVNDQWQAQTPAQIADLAAISFTGEQLGWAYAAPVQGDPSILTLYTTRDGGKTWQKAEQNVVETQFTSSQGG